MVLFIYRPEYYGLTEDEGGESAKGKAVISIAKHRNGKLGDVTLKFVGQYAKFEDVVETYGGASDGNTNIMPNNNFEQFTTKVVSSRMNDDFLGA
jgi:replicative DNA helicase